MQIGNKLSVDDISVKDKRVLMRVDFNVPMKGNTITNNQRIVAALPTINYCLAHNAKSIVLMSHLGRPDGKVIPELSLKPIAVELERLLKRKVLFLDDCVGEHVKSACKNPENGAVILLENLRFHLEEEGSIKTKEKTIVASEEQLLKFRHQLESLGDIYVNDAFGTMHRAHSSITGINLGVRASGFLVKKELDYFSKVLEGPQKLSLAILGGAKVADKLPLIFNLIDKTDKIAIGGGMAFTFLKVLNNMSIGSSLFDEKGSKMILEIMEKAKSENVQIILPVDFMIGDSFSAAANCKITESVIPDGWMGLDIGPKSIQIFQKAIMDSSSILWNGPAGVFEFENFANGTRSITESLVESCKNGAIVIVGGGDSAAAVAQFGAEDKLSHVSTGGGASLELLEGKELPGVTFLSDKQKNKL